MPPVFTPPPACRAVALERGRTIPTTAATPLYRGVDRRHLNERSESRATRHKHNKANSYQSRAGTATSSTRKPAKSYPASTRDTPAPGSPAPAPTSSAPTWTSSIFRMTVKSSPRARPSTRASVSAPPCPTAASFTRPRPAACKSRKCRPATTKPIKR